jgi:diguanylate cyclase (GGDEF)-like protein/PAS domain S-box-containing protein
MVNSLSIANVLIVENEPFNARHLRRELLKLDFDVCEILTTGEDVIAKLTTLQPDLILMDIGLDGVLDGIETATRIAAIKPTPIIYLSGATDEATLTRARKTKPYGYLVKPYSEQTLNATLQMLMERVETDRALADSQARLREAALVFDATQDGILILDQSKKITTANQRFSEITGFSATEIIGAHPYFLNVETLSTALFEQIDNDFRNGRRSSQIDVTKKNGTLLPANVTIAGIHSADDMPGATSQRPHHYVILISDLTAVRMAEEKLYRMAHHDPLTGLPNRQLAIDRLRQTIEQAKRRRSRMAVFFIDLDNFKRINDSLGHAIGDELLCAAASRMQTCVRSVDTVARLGGDEFLVILDNIDDIKTVSGIASKMLSALSKPFAMVNVDSEVFSSASIGISLFPEAGTHPDQLIRAADTAMYHAKSRGRCAYSFYTARMMDNAGQRADQKRQLRDAIDQQQLRLYYQPRVALQDGSVVGVEALLRWQHPDKGLLDAASIIALAEGGECMTHLNQWVLRAACAQLRDWQTQELAAVQMGINLSAAQFFDPDFLPLLENILDEFGIAAPQLEIEITEATLQSEKLHDEVFDAIRTLGVGLAIDDFGTGNSNANTLKRLPIQRIKIDRRFIRELPFNTEDVTVAKAMIAMISKLEIVSVAEGIETPEQDAFLRSHGCDEAQGYYYAAALPAESMAQLLRPQHGDTANLKVRH